MDNKEIIIENGIPSIDLDETLKIQRNIQTTMTNISLSNLYLFVERGDPLTTISQQILLSETIELLTGSFVSEDIWLYRGLLLNIEHALTYFYLFSKIFNFLKDSYYSQISFQGFLALQNIFEIVWEIRFPWGFIRPAAMLEPIRSNQIPKIKRIIDNQVKRAFLIAKRIEKNSKLKQEFRAIKLLDNLDIKTTGITGPICRTLGLLPAPISFSTKGERKSAQYFIQHSYTKENNLWNLVRISYAELILALNRTAKLLKSYPVKSSDLINQSLDGDITQSFQTVLGKIYLTLNISDNKVKFFNYIPSQIINLRGMKRMFNLCPNSLHPILLYFYDPKLIYNIEDII